MTSAFKKYWRDVAIPCTAAVAVGPGYWLVTHNIYGIIYGITAPVALVLAVRLGFEPIHAYYRCQAKVILNVRYGRAGYRGGRAEGFKPNDTERN